jgi:hypothetical protein
MPVKPLTDRQKRCDEAVLEALRLAVSPVKVRRLDYIVGPFYPHEIRGSLRRLVRQGLVTMASSTFYPKGYYEAVLKD